MVAWFKRETVRQVARATRDISTGRLETDLKVEPKDLRLDLRLESGDLGLDLDLTEETCVHHCLSRKEVKVMRF